MLFGSLRAERSQSTPRGASLSNHRPPVRPHDVPRTSYIPARPAGPSCGTYAGAADAPVSLAEHRDLEERVSQLTTVWRSGSRRLELLEAVSAEQDAKIAATVEVVRRVQSLLEESQSRANRQIATLTAELVSLRREATEPIVTLTAELVSLRREAAEPILELRRSLGEAHTRLAALGAAVDVSDSHIHHRVKEALASHGAESRATLAQVRATLDGLLPETEAARLRHQHSIEEGFGLVSSELARLSARVAAVEEESDHRVNPRCAVRTVAAERRAVGGGGGAARAGGTPAPAVSPMRAYFNSQLGDPPSRAAARPPTAVAEQSGVETPAPGAAGASAADAPAAAAQTLLAALSAVLTPVAQRPAPWRDGASPGSESSGAESISATLVALQSQIDRLQARAGAACEALGNT